MHTGNTPDVFQPPRSERGVIPADLVAALTPHNGTMFDDEAPVRRRKKKSSGGFPDTKSGNSGKGKKGKKRRPSGATYGGSEYLAYVYIYTYVYICVCVYLQILLYMYIYIYIYI
jgi:hypothetical protein